MVEHSEPESEEDNIFRRAIESALAPIRVLTSRSAIKAYLSTLLFLLTSTALLTISTTAYLFFYINYIPPINLQENIYLQYGLGACPYAITPLDHATLIAQQPYDIAITLNMPRTPTNLAAGNFMIDLQLLGPHNPLAQPPDSARSFYRNLTAKTTSGLTILHQSRRPAMLTYTSPIPYLAKTLLYLPLDLMRFRDLDTACLRVPMFERLSLLRGSANIPTHVRLEITSDSAANTGSTPPTFNIPYLGTASAPTAGDIKPRALQVYSSKISFCARFHGLRYIIYNYRVLSFLAFTAMFYMSSVVSMALAWAGISTFLYNNGKDQEGNITIKREQIEGGDERKRKAEDELDDGNAKIKEEEQGGSTSGGLSEKNLSDTPATFPTGSREPPLQYLGRPLPPGLTAAQQQRLRMGEVADDEEDAGPNPSQAMMERAWDTSRGRDADSGLGTSLESEGPGLARRRSGRMSASGSRDRRQ